MKAKTRVFPWECMHASDTFSSWSHPPKCKVNTISKVKSTYGDEKGLSFQQFESPSEKGSREVCRLRLDLLSEKGGILPTLQFPSKTQSEDTQRIRSHLKKPSRIFLNGEVTTHTICCVKESLERTDLASNTIFRSNWKPPNLWSIWNPSCYPQKKQRLKVCRHSQMWYNLK